MMFLCFFFYVITGKWVAGSLLYCEKEDRKKLIYKNLAV